MKQYKIELFTMPVFDDQYKFRVTEIIHGDNANEDKEVFICSGNDTLVNVKKEVEYWFNKQPITPNGVSDQDMIELGYKKV